MRQPLVWQLWNGLNRLLEPIYTPVRNILPNTGGLDLAPLVVFIGVIILQRGLINNRASALGEVRIKAVHRGERSLEPKADLRLLAGDRLVLFGTAVAMEQAEQRLLEGH